jgi:hypothetical protein
MDVYTYEFWAQSLTDKGFGTEVPVKENVIRYKTVYLSHRPYGPKATAQICLSRVDGSGTARCLIEGYSFFFQTEPDPLYAFPGSYSGPTDTMAIVLAGPGSITINNAHSITFQVGVSNMFAYATATIFVERVGLLQRLLTTAVEAVSARSRSALAGAVDPARGNTLTHVAYDPRTGEILQLHDAVAVRGVRLPEESELARVSARLFSGSPLASDHLAIASVSGPALEPGSQYSMDLKTQRLIAGLARSTSGDASKAD